MTDKELLELAAKAAGFANWSYASEESGICVELGCRRGAITSYWNPLTDDGDALRLAVKLQMRITNEDNKIISAEFYYGEMDHYFAAELIANDPYAATRRAIVRAAAEIDKAM